MTNASIDTNKTSIQAVNSTVGDWGVEPLPSLIYLKNGTFKAADNSTFTRAHTTAIGGVALVSFIYMLMSLVIIVLMVRKSVSWIRGVSSSSKYKWEPQSRPGFLSVRKFESRLRRCYPKHSSLQAMSFDERVPRSSGTQAQDVRECGELIRTKFRLDLKVYNLRDANEMDRPILEDMRKRSEGAMADIRKATAGWNALRNQWSAEEWEVVKEIHEVVQVLGTR